MVYLSYTYDFKLYNESNKVETGHCDGTLLTEKIILSAAHCCKPLLWPSIANILGELISDKCELQKCQGNLIDEECIEALTECVWSKLSKCGINMDKCELQKCQGDLVNLECLKALTECVGSELSKGGINMDANEECEELSYYLNRTTKLTDLKNATVEAGWHLKNNN